MLRYARVRFMCKWGEEGKRMGSPLAWRDELEKAFRRVACILPRQDCAQCVVRSRCAYSGFFMPDGRSGDSSRPPLPLAFVFPEAVDAEGFFSLEMTLLHPWVGRLPYWLFALSQMKRNRRRPFQVLQGEEWTGEGWERFYNGEEETLEKVVEAKEPCGLSLRGEELMLRWIRPGRLLRNGRPLVDLGFRDLVEALLRRVGALERFYGQGNAFPKGDLMEKAKLVSLEPLGLRWVERHRFSRRQQGSVALGGLMGSMLLRGDIEPFGKILALGRDLGVGKGTGLGLGRYEVAAP